MASKYTAATDENSGGHESRATTTTTNDHAAAAEDIPLLPGLERSNLPIPSIRSGYGSGTLATVYGARVIQVATSIFILNVVTKVIVVIVDAATSNENDLDFGVLDLILTVFCSGILTAAAIQGVKLKNPKFCFLSYLEWYLLFSIAFCMFSFIGFIAGCVGGDAALLVPSLIFFCVITYAIYSVVIFLLYLNQRKENDAVASPTSSGV